MQRFRMGDTVTLGASGAEVGVIVALDGAAARVSWPTRGRVVALGELVAARLAPDPARRFQLGDRVMKNPAAWIANAFDGWGRGEGIGVVVPGPFPPADGEYDVVWPGGRCFEQEAQLLPAP